MSRQEAMHELGLPWCEQLINDPSWSLLPSRSEIDNALYSQTLWSDQTIRAYQSFYKASAPGKSGGEVRILLSIGTGLDSLKGICHGGILTLLMDDAMQELASRDSASSNLTATIKSAFHKPLRTPAVVLCRAWKDEGSVGRKSWVKGQVEDGEGNVFASAEGLFIKLKENL